MQKQAHPPLILTDETFHPKVKAFHRTHGRYLMYVAKYRLPTFLIAWLLSMHSSLVAYQEPQASERKLNEQSERLNDDVKNWNVELPTTGGMQFWTDHRWWYGWRIQYNSTLKHWRLIDPKSVRRAWGGRQAMLDELERIKPSLASEPEPKEVVLLLHGLMRTSGSMKPLEAELAKSDDQIRDIHPESSIQRTVISFSYSSTRDPMSNHAAAFREFVENLPGSPRISLVGHSMGNIVLRYAIGDWQRQGDPKHVLDRLHRVVMLGPPNQGSLFAKRLSRLGLFGAITGHSGMQLGPKWEDFGDALGVPPCPFAIVAGDISNSNLQNPLLEGPSDGVVAVKETHLDGVAEFATVSVLHSFLMSDPNVVKATVSFLSGTGLKSALQD
jgi:pimeloyl-ACP methyl ester carboxylesterase